MELKLAKNKTKQENIISIIPILHTVFYNYCLIL